MKKNKLVGKIIDCTLNILIVLFAIFLLISMYTAFQVKVLKNQYSNFFGYSLFEVQTGSMHGTIEAGDWIIVKTTRDVGIGDVVTYKHGSEFITHRIIESYKGTFITKGDANNAKDEPIDQSQIVGKVVKTLHGFGILRRTIFNPFVILLLIVSLYLFNLTFKTGKSEFDLKVEKIIKVLKEIIKEKMGSKKVSSTKNDSDIKKEKVRVTIESPKEIIESPKEEPNIITVVNEIEENTSNVDNLNGNTSDDIITKQNDSDEKIIPKQDDDLDTSEEKVIPKQSEDELSKTAMFRMISIQPDDNSEYYKEEEKTDNEEIVDVDDLSKTAIFRTIPADTHDVDTKENKVVEEHKEKYTEVVSLSLNAEAIEEEVVEHKITKEYITERIKSKKAKNILDKSFFIKRIVYDEILTVLLKNERAYINKSNMRNQFIDEYMNLKYFSFDVDRKNIKKAIKSYGDDLISKFIRDEKKVNTAKAYTDCFILISNIEDKTKCDIKSEVQNLYDYDDEVISNMAFDIEQIITFANENINEILEKLDTNTFEVKYNKIVGKKSLYGVVLKHNIAFSKVYSDYIVDKTYSEGIISEDKLAVLLNMLLCKLVSDMMKSDYDSKYIVYIPNPLYGKDKKLDKLVSTIDNEYAKNHIFFLTSVSNMLNNKEDIKRLRKKGYGFALAFNKSVDLKNDDMGYIYMADYYFIDSYLDVSKVCETLPTEIINNLIKDSISKKIGDYGGD